MQKTYTKTKRAIKRAVRAVRNAVARYDVHIYWDDVLYTHRALTMREALEWSACYALHIEAIIIDRARATIVAAR
jgi:hypothetical protein